MKHETITITLQEDVANELRQKAGVMGLNINQLVKLAVMSLKEEMEEIKWKQSDSKQR